MNFLPSEWDHILSLVQELAGKWGARRTREAEEGDSDLVSLNLILCWRAEILIPRYRCPALMSLNRNRVRYPPTYKYIRSYLISNNPRRKVSAEQTRTNNL